MKMIETVVQGFFKHDQCGFNRRRSRARAPSSPRLTSAQKPRPSVKKTPIAGPPARRLSKMQGFRPAFPHPKPPSPRPQKSPPKGAPRPPLFMPPPSARRGRSRRPLKIDYGHNPGLAPKGAPRPEPPPPPARRGRRTRPDSGGRGDSEIKNSILGAEPPISCPARFFQSFFKKFAFLFKPRPCAVR